MASKISFQLKTIGTLILLAIAFPVNCTIVFLSVLVSWIMVPFRQRTVAADAKNILLTGGKMTKALQLARSFHASGHQVFLVETHKYWLSGHRFSNAVRHFSTIPAPEIDPDGYYKELLKLVKKEKIDVFIPVSSPVSSYHDAVAGVSLSPYCEVNHFSPATTSLLDNKFTFCEQARSLGLTAPNILLITDPQQILDFDFTATQSQYILKSIHYDSVTRLDLVKFPFDGMEDYVRKLPISHENPWVFQEFIRGQEYCTHSTVRDGKIRLHCCSESSPFQVNYRHVDKPKILSWVEEFVASLRLTGQISFDFIEAKDGNIYPIECNPRTHSAITMFYNHPDLTAAYLDNAAEMLILPVQPLSNSKPTYWLYHELWRLTETRSWSDLQSRMRTILKGKDAILQTNDPIPFLAVHHWQITLLLLRSLAQFKDWYRIDFNIGKLVELSGD